MSLIEYFRAFNLDIQKGKRLTGKGTLFAQGSIYSINEAFSQLLDFQTQNKISLKFNDIRSSIIENPVIVLDELAAKGIEIYVNTLKIIATSSRNFEKVTCIKYLTLSLFYGPLFNVFKKKIDSASFRSPKLSTGFFHLLERHFREEHELSYYADKLNISVRYLYANVRSTTGKSPGYWIDYYMMSEAKKLLADMELSIVQVSDTLNFAGLSQFGKFFKKHEGISPSAYRKSLT